MQSRFKQLRLAQLDEALVRFRDLATIAPPSEGWVRTIRKALGMSLRQLADRIGAAPSTVSELERNEAAGVIQLSSLHRLAEALGCQVVYTLVPRESLEAVVGERARLIAEQLVKRVSASMEMEEQGIAEEERVREIDELTARLIDERPRDLWDDPVGPR